MVARLTIYICKCSTWNDLRWGGSVSRGTEGGGQGLQKGRSKGPAREPRVLAPKASRRV